MVIFFGETESRHWDLPMPSISTYNMCSSPSKAFPFDRPFCSRAWLRNEEKKTRLGVGAQLFRGLLQCGGNGPNGNIELSSGEKDYIP